MTHDEAAELLAAMALDALESDVHASVDEHVLTCPECQRELDSLREVASALGNTYEAPPEGLWSQIATRLYETDPSDAPSRPEFLGDFDPAGQSDPRPRMVTWRIWNTPWRTTGTTEWQAPSPPPGTRLLPSAEPATRFSRRWSFCPTGEGI
jgi:hypothetical protein